MNRFSLKMIMAAFAVIIVSPVYAADHMDSPRVLTNGRLDLNDIYLFNAPGSTNRVVLIATVSPAAGVLNATTFDSRGFYEFAIDLDGNAVEDAVIRSRFSAPNANGVQNMSVSFISRTRPSGVQLGKGLTNTNLTFHTGGHGPVVARAGLADDPFFFDLAAFRRFVANGNPNEFGSQPTNFFGTFNTLAIVIELPTSILGLRKGDTTIGVWGRTIVNGQQFERTGIPVVNTVFIRPNAQKDSFNITHPSNDRALFRSLAINTLASAPYNVPTTTASGIVDFVLPDVLPLDLAAPGGFPNGRRLEDDVIDTLLGVVSLGGINTDFIDNDSTFQPNFPYIGVPRP